MVRLLQSGQRSSQRFSLASGTAGAGRGYNTLSTQGQGGISWSNIFLV